MADEVLHLAALTSDGQVGTELGRLTLRDDGTLVAGGDQPDLVEQVFGGIAGRYGKLSRVEVFRHLVADGRWSNTKVTFFSARETGDGS